MSSVTWQKDFADVIRLTDPYLQILKEGKDPGSSSSNYMSKKQRVIEKKGTRGQRNPQARKVDPES